MLRVSLRRGPNAQQTNNENAAGFYPGFIYGIEGFSHMTTLES